MHFGVFPILGIPPCTFPIHYARDLARLVDKNIPKVEICVGERDVVLHAVRLCNLRLCIFVEREIVSQELVEFCLVVELQLLALRVADSPI